MSEESERLKAARVAAGFASAGEAAERLGIPYPTYSAHENGSRGYRAGAAERYARAFGTTAEYLLFGRKDGAGEIRYETPQHEAGGFAESELTPWEGPRRNDTPDPIAALAPGAGHPTAYRLGKAVPGFSLLKGDVVILDLKTPAKRDDIVVARIVDTDIGDAQTVLRRYLPPYLVTATSAEPSEIADDGDIAIMGPVVASFRLNRQD